MYGTDYKYKYLTKSWYVKDHLSNRLVPVDRAEVIKAEGLIAVRDEEIEAEMAAEIDIMDYCDEMCIC